MKFLTSIALVFMLTLTVTANATIPPEAKAKVNKQIKEYVALADFTKTPTSEGKVTVFFIVKNDYTIEILNVEGKDDILIKKTKELLNGQLLVVDKSLLNVPLKVRVSFTAP